jgi:urease accessory protein
MLRAHATSRTTDPIPFDVVVLTHAERHVRRRIITLQHGDELLVDLPRAVVLAHGDRLQLEDGRHVEIIAAEEELMQVRAGSATTLAALAWHLGNRHVPAQIEMNRILIERDRVIRDMLRGLGAWVENVSEPFEPLLGAYHRHSDAGTDRAPA